MDFELVSEDSVPALDARIFEVCTRIKRLDAALMLLEAELDKLRAAKAARTPVRRSCEG